MGGRIVYVDVARARGGVRPRTGVRAHRGHRCEGLEAAFLEWWQQYQKTFGFTKKWIQTHEQQVRLLAKRVLGKKYNPHEGVLTVNERVLNSKKFELLETAAGDASVHSMAQLHLRKPGAQAVADYCLLRSPAQSGAPDEPQPWP